MRAGDAHMRLETGSSNGLLAIGTKPLSELLLINCKL